MPLKLKLDEQGHAVLADGKVVYVDDADSNKEYQLDGAHLYGRVTALTTENGNLRKDKEAAETKLQTFAGIEDPAKAIEAINTVANLDSGQLLTAGKVDEIKKGVNEAAEQKYGNIVKAKDDQIAALTTERDGLRTGWFNERLTNDFATSKWIEDNVAVPRDLLRAQFGPNFKNENDKTVPYDQAGNVIYSRSNPGEPAGFEEAIQILVEAYPHKADIMKGNGGGGGGGQQPNPQTPGPRGKQTGNLGGTREERMQAIGARFPNLPKQ